MDMHLEENAEIFVIDGDKVIFYGRDSGGECFKYDFPSEYLSLSNKELLLVVERINREREEAKIKAKIQKDEFDNAVTDLAPFLHAFKANPPTLENKSNTSLFLQ